MSHYESPEYEIKSKEDNYEIREYKDFYIVEYENPNDPDLSYGFGTLFKYIGKENDQNESISMTIPVIREVTSSGMKMAFVVPQSKWDNIPHPTDKRLKISKFDKGIFATITYSGSLTLDKERKQIQLLQAWIHEKNLSPLSNFMVANYNGPFTPSIFRRNEILVRVE